ncbi:hypothetical protein FG386_001713 [Cryptosporidium ryanae]|uniref:uncharacterized protein n=1 Tax=Cryptosporidium ryanae TaxID=515981 RepID=UPI00351A0437|nr:hypothetical protein FG386_001713 [Cryptosporidium ryanae]
MSNLSIIQGDLNELKTLKSQCKRDGVKMILNNQIRLLEEKQRNMSISDNCRRNFENIGNSNTNVVLNNISSTNSQYTNIEMDNSDRKTTHNSTNNNNSCTANIIPIEAYTPITKYSWDQTDKNIKIYIDLVGVQDKPDCLELKFGKDNIEMLVKNLDNKFYIFTVKLHSEITSNECTHKIKKDMVIITLRKTNSNAKWPRLSYKDSPLKKSSNSDNIGNGIMGSGLGSSGGLGDMGLDSSDMENPMSGIQNLMRKMYEEGDDEMKRTIAKAWTEAQSKTLNMP